MRPDFIHAERRRECAAAYNLNSGKLQKSLYSAVLSVLTVKHGEGKVYPEALYSALSENENCALSSFLGNHGSGTGFAVQPLIGLDVIDIALVEVGFAVFAYSHKQNTVVFSVNILNYGRGRG